MANPFFAEVKQLLSEKHAEIKYPFMVNRILSFTPEACMKANEVNPYVGRLPDWAINPLLNLVIPKNNRRTFFNYIGKKKKKKDKKLTNKIRQTFCVNEFHAKQIIEILRAANKHPERFYGLKEGE